MFTWASYNMTPRWQGMQIGSHKGGLHVFPQVLSLTWRLAAA